MKSYNFVDQCDASEPHWDYVTANWTGKRDTKALAKEGHIRT